MAKQAMARRLLWRWVGGWAIGLLAAVLIIPGVLVKRGNPVDLGQSYVTIAIPKEEASPQMNPQATEQPDQEQVLDEEVGPTISVYRTDSGLVEKIGLEAYVRGVVAAEMPVDFELEALKAQAIAARTYVVRRLLDGSFQDVPGGAQVTDSVSHQAFVSDEQLQARWGDQYKQRIDKLNQAVRETAGLIVTYAGMPITAAYFSTSNGYTENSEDYWGEALPYLRSVPSPWDQELSPRFEETIEISLEKMNQQLGVSNVQLATGSKGKAPFVQLEKTAGGRVKTFSLYDHILAGRKTREQLGLNSTHFVIKIEGQKAVITTYGYGHGVGMSQYGAQGMALKGHDAKEIIQYYYHDVVVERAGQHLATAKQKVETVEGGA